jgi:RHS repeat-associated protein
MSLSYDNRNRVIQITDALGGTTRFAYDGVNNVTAVTDPNGNTTSFGYVQKGVFLPFNIAAVSDPLGNAFRFTYDAQNNVTSATTPNGLTYSFSYDARGNLVSSLDPLGAGTLLEYDALGEVIGVTDARGNRTSYTYDGQGNLINISDAVGGQATMSYDGIGRLLALSDPNNSVWGARYDANSQLTEAVDPLGNPVRLGYNEIGQTTTITDAAGNTTQYTYDEVGNLVAVMDPLGGKTTYQYDADNNLTAITDANGHSSKMVYDALNRISSSFDPIGNEFDYLYDLAGNIILIEDGRSIVNQFTYDSDNRLVQISFGDGTTVQNTYDPNGNRVVMADSTGVTQYQYDELDRVIGIASPDAFIGFDYDNVGNRVALQYSDGKLVTYAYDEVNRLTRITDRNKRETVYSYDAADHVTNVQYPNGVSRSFQYDAAGRLTKVINASRTATLSSYEYLLDALGNRTRKIINGQSVISYGYDALSRLVSVSVPATSYSYDAVGNMVNYVIQGQSVPMTYDKANQLRTAGGSSFTYDRNGNLIKKNQSSGVTDYAFDAANRLIRVSRGGQIKTYEYDGNGNKVRELQSGLYTTFVNDFSPLNPIILSESGSIFGTIHYVFGLDRISANSTGFQYFYDTDGLGSVVDLTTGSGGLAAAYNYDAWGQSQRGSTSRVANRFGFTGEELDNFTGLYYLRSRWYDPSIKRFISRDFWPGSLRSPQSLNRYAYVINNPQKLTDPNGDCPWCVALGAATSVVSGAVIRGVVSGNFSDIFDLRAIAIDAVAGAVGAGVITRATVAYQLVRAGTGINKARYLGALGEAAIGANDAKTAILVGGRTLFPDILGNFIQEAKNVATIGARDAKQILDYVRFSGQRAVEVFTRPGTSVSRIQSLLDNGSVVQKMLPGINSQGVFESTGFAITAGAAAGVGANKPSAQGGK